MGQDLCGSGCPACQMAGAIHFKKVGKWICACFLFAQLSGIMYCIYENKHNYCFSKTDLNLSACKMLSTNYWTSISPLSQFSPFELAQVPQLTEVKAKPSKQFQYSFHSLQLKFCSHKLRAKKVKPGRKNGKSTPL